jgi:hypothetical protein
MHRDSQPVGECIPSSNNVLPCPHQAFDMHQKAYKDRMKQLPCQNIEVLSPNGEVRTVIAWRTTPLDIAIETRNELATKALIAKVKQSFSLTLILHGTRSTNNCFRSTINSGTCIVHWKPHVPWISWTSIHLRAMQKSSESSGGLVLWSLAQHAKLTLSDVCQVRVASRHQMDSSTRCR